ncbi:MAG: hypothetical protein ABSE07_04660 [Methanoregula sp.]|jgi:SSS family solute:Na+ symporter
MSIDKSCIVQYVSGKVLWFGWTAFFHAAEAKPLGICKAIFGKVTLLGQNWAAIDPIVIVLSVSMIITSIMQWQYGKQ